MYAMQITYYFYPHDTDITVTVFGGIDFETEPGYAYFNSYGHGYRVAVKDIKKIEPVNH